MLARKGAEAVKQKTPTPRRSRAHFHAMEAVNMDGHQCNVFVEFEDGTVTRPMLVGIQDLCSGLFVSTRVDRSENWHIVRLAIGDMVRDYGIPEHIYLDNGRAFAAKGITGRVPNRFRFKVRKEDPQGLLPSLGVNVHWTLPYNGRAKPIERAWREISERIAKHPICEGAYTGPNVTAKPENYGSKAVPIAQFRQLVADEIAFFNAREGRRTETAAGRSYLATFNESMALPTTLVKCPTLEQTRLWLLAAESQKVRTHTGEMVLYGNRFHHPALADHRGETMTGPVRPGCATWFHPRLSAERRVSLRGRLHCGRRVRRRGSSARLCPQSAGIPEGKPRSSRRDRSHVDRRADRGHTPTFQDHETGALERGASADRRACQAPRSCRWRIYR